MITGFFPEKVSELMIILGFTNMVAVIKNKIYRQDLNHFKINKTDEGLQAPIQRSFLKIAGEVF